MPHRTPPVLAVFVAGWLCATALPTGVAWAKCLGEVFDLDQRTYQSTMTVDEAGNPVDPPPWATVRLSVSPEVFTGAGNSDAVADFETPGSEGAWTEVRLREAAP